MVKAYKLVKVRGGNNAHLQPGGSVRSPPSPPPAPAPPGPPAGPGVRARASAAGSDVAPGPPFPPSGSDEARLRRTGAVSLTAGQGAVRGQDPARLTAAIQHERARAGGAAGPGNRAGSDACRLWRANIWVARGA